jgi:hypothetical protein
VRREKLGDVIHRELLAVQEVITLTKEE